MADIQEVDDYEDPFAELTERQARFAYEYTVDGNATAAYKRSGYSATGNSAEVGGSKLVRNVKVKGAIDWL